MLYLYDNALVEDLKKSFNPTGGASDVVKVLDPDLAIDAAAQIQNDEFTFPAVVLTRNPYSIDNSRINFTRFNRGVSAVIDPETNMVYNEKALPITLSYNLTVLATNTVDMDEITRELLFKYYSQYFLSIDLPYEADRKMRFGVRIDQDNDIEASSRLLEYLQNGKAYQNIIHLTCEGCVLLSYTPRQLMRFGTEQVIALGH